MTPDSPKIEPDTDAEGFAAYDRLLEATLFAEAFNELLQPEETASFFLNIVHHFFPYRAGVVYPLGMARMPLAERSLNFEVEKEISRHLTEEWLQQFRHELRPIEIPKAKGDFDETTYVAVPLVFGGDLLAYAILVCQTATWSGEEKDIVRVLGRAAGAALGRIYQARRIEEERDYAKAIFSSVVSAFINVDLNGKIYEANAAARGLLGENIVGHYYKDLFKFSGIDPIGACLQNRLPQQHVDARSNAGTIWGITVSPLIIAERMSGVIAGFRDITKN